MASKRSRVAGQDQEQGATKSLFTEDKEVSNEVIIEKKLSTMGSQVLSKPIEIINQNDEDLEPPDDSLSPKGAGTNYKYMKQQE